MTMPPDLAQRPLETETGSGNAPPPSLPKIWGESNLPPVLISDIDNTIAFLPFDEKGTPARGVTDFSKSDNDIPNEKVMGLVKAWYSLTENPTIYFCTGRSAEWRDITVRWLVRYFPPSAYRWVLRMRPANDPFSSAASIKEGHLVNEIVKKYAVKQVWEDNPDCILMYRSHGLVVMDAKETWPNKGS